jgi:hypothetical protein
MFCVACSGAAFAACVLGLPAAIAGEAGVVTSRAGNEVVYGSTVIHSTTNAVLDLNAIALPNGTGVVVVWNEVSAEGATPHYAFSLDGSSFSRALDTDYLIKLQYATFDPLSETPAIDPSLAAGSGHTTFIVQFVTQPLEPIQEMIAAMGGEAYALIHSNALAVNIAPEQLSALSQHPLVRWVGPVHPAYKLDASILAQLAAGTNTGAGRFSVGCFTTSDAQKNVIVAAIEGMGGQVHWANPGGYSMNAELTLAQVVQLAHLSEVSFIDPWGPGGHDMNIVRQNVGAVPTLSGAGFTGQGVRGEIFDTEVQSNHPQWNGQAPLIHGVNGNSGTHGSSCYGINFATGTGNAQATGMCPSREQGIFYWYTQAWPFGAQPRLQANQQAIDPLGAFKSCYQTSSVGSTQVSNYTNISQDTDNYLFMADYLSFQSQSNTGNTLSRPQAWAKNIVSVGGVEIKETVNKLDDSQSGASIGPAQDGRVKPDLCNSYSGIFTTTAGSGYTNFGGTSGATPITAGCGGLITQMWHQGVWKHHGGKATVFESRPNSATVKGILANTAYQYNLTPVQGGMTRARQGWGLPQVDKPYLERDNMYISDQQHILCPGKTNKYTFQVPAGMTELAVTMVYKDPAPAVLTSPNRVNDLSLRVTSPGGTVYWGNNGLNTANTSSAGGVSNKVDTVENVFLTNPQAGPWTVEVLGDDINKEGYLKSAALDANYSLIFRGKTTAAVGCPGDLDVDGDIDQSDLGIILAAYGSQACDANYSPFADLDADGDVDQGDLGTLLAFYGTNC